jgi:hypothetical protein
VNYKRTFPDTRCPQLRLATGAASHGFHVVPGPYSGIIRWRLVVIFDLMNVIGTLSHPTAATIAFGETLQRADIVQIPVNQLHGRQRGAH